MAISIIPALFRHFTSTGIGIVSVPIFLISACHSGNLSISRFWISGISLGTSKSLISKLSVIGLFLIFGFLTHKMQFIK